MRWTRLRRVATHCARWIITNYTNVWDLNETLTLLTRTLRASFACEVACCAQLLNWIYLLYKHIKSYRNYFSNSNEIANLLNKLLIHLYFVHVISHLGVLRIWQLKNYLSAQHKNALVEVRRYLEPRGWLNENDLVFIIKM